MKTHRESCEAEFHQRAIEYKNELLKDQAKGASQLQATVDLLRSENLGLTTQRNALAMVDNQEQRKASQAAVRHGPYLTIRLFEKRKPVLVQGE